MPLHLGGLYFVTGGAIMPLHLKLLNVVAIAAPLVKLPMTGMVTSSAVKHFVVGVLTVWNNAFPSKQGLHEETSMSF
jgi:hypothetical protein